MFKSIIYAKRKAAGLSQEELAEIVGISANAVSKWERGASIPDINVMCSLADYFDVTLDELVGRNYGKPCSAKLYDEEKLKLCELNDILLNLSEVSRREGLLAMEQAINKSDVKNEFLRFSVKFILDMFQKGMSVTLVNELLHNYANALPESERKAGEMTAEVMSYIISGERKEYIAEVIASFVGMEYRDKLNLDKNVSDYNAKIEELYAKEPYSEQTMLLEGLADSSDGEIQMIIKNIDNITLVNAIKGASGKVAKAFMTNLSERLRYYIYEDIIRLPESEASIIKAQKKILEQIYIEESIEESAEE